MNILVVGGAGYIADSLTTKLEENGHNVVVYDNLLYADYFFKPIEFILKEIQY